MSFSAASSLDALFAPWTQIGSPGIALGLVQHGHLVYTKGYGLANVEDNIPITSSSVFHVASVSKQFTAALLLQLALEKKLSLSDDIHRFIPTLPHTEIPITLQHCLWHCSGFRDQWELLYLAGWRDGDLVTTDDIIRLLCRQHELNFVPGSQFCYCNSGYTLLGQVIEQVTGVSLRTYAQDQLFRPLDMAHTFFQDDHTLTVPQRVIAYAPHADGHFRICVPMFDTVGATGLQTTVEDLARWIAHLDTLYAGHAELLAQILTPGTLSDGQPLPYGAGLFLGTYRGYQTVSHTGSDYGYRAQVVWFPQRQKALLLLCNLATVPLRVLGQKVADILLDEVQAVFPGEGASPVTQQKLFVAPTDPPNEAELLSLSGLYHHPATEAVRRCVVIDGQLMLHYGPGTRLCPIGPRHFRLEGTLLELRFGLYPNGQRWLEEQDADGLVMRYDAVPEGHLTEEQFTSYIGLYTSDEVATSYRIVLRDHALFLLHDKFPPRLLTPTIQESFWMEEDIRLCFTREADQVVGFFTWTHRVRHVFFKKQGASLVHSE